RLGGPVRPRPGSARRSAPAGGPPAGLRLDRARAGRLQRGLGGGHPVRRRPAVRRDAGGRGPQPRPRRRPGGRLRGGRVRRRRARAAGGRPRLARKGCRTGGANEASAKPSRPLTLEHPNRSDGDRVQEQIIQWLAILPLVLAAFRAITIGDRLYAPIVPRRVGGTDRANPNYAPARPNLVGLG